MGIIQSCLEGTAKFRTRKVFRFHEIEDEPITEENALITIPLFDDMSPKHLKTIQASFERLSFKKGDIVCSTGEELAGFFAIVSGCVEIQARKGGVEGGDEFTMSRLGPGRWFGEVVLLEGKPMVAPVTITSLEDTVILSLSAAKYNEMVESEHALKAHVRSRGVTVRLSGLPFFEGVSEQKLALLSGLFVFKHVPAGVIIFNEGDAPDGFYIVCRGNVQVTANDAGGESKLLATLTDGAFFGELALINDMARTATCRTVTTSTMVYLSKDNFHTFLTYAPEVKTGRFVETMNMRTANLLKTIPIFSRVLRVKQKNALEIYNEKQICQLANLFTFERVGASKVIFSEGDVGDALYFILRGSVSVTNKKAGTLREMKAGSCFGELALLHAVPRTATVTTSEDTLLFKLASENFNNFLNIAPEFKSFVETAMSSEVHEEVRSSVSGANKGKRPDPLPGPPSALSDDDDAVGGDEGGAVAAEPALGDDGGDDDEEGEAMARSAPRSAPPSFAPPSFAPPPFAPAAASAPSMQSSSAAELDDVGLDVDAAMGVSFDATEEELA
eukprot:Rmarinus@m.28128